MQPTADLSPQAAVSRLLLLADERHAAHGPRERADARVRRYRLARLKLDEAARLERHAHLRASYD